VAAVGTISGVGMVRAGSNYHLADGPYWTVDRHLSVQVGNRYCVSDLWIHSRRIVPAAWLYNPLLFSVLAVSFIAIVVRLFFARSVRVHLTHTERAIAWVLAIALFCINWAYVVLCVG
jgi:hypothetical protein